MAVIIKSLTDTQLSASSAQNDATWSYSPQTSPVSRMAVVRNIRLANADPDAVVPAVVKIECKTADDSRDSSESAALRMASPTTVTIPPSGLHVVLEEITLGPGDEVKLTLFKPASGTAKLDVVISGIERGI